MSSILNNSAALSALQSLQMTQQSLATVENQVSTGLRVASAADNSSYWSIATQLNNDSGIVTAANSALSEGQSVLATASSAINSVITTLNSMATALTEAQNPGANIGNINTSLTSLGQQLTDAVNAASFNGLNVLNGTQNSLSFVAGFNASATGGTVNSISFAVRGPDRRLRLDAYHDDDEFDDHRLGDDRQPSELSTRPGPTASRSATAPTPSPPMAGQDRHR